MEQPIDTTSHHQEEGVGSNAEEALQRKMMKSKRKSNISPTPLAPFGMSDDDDGNDDEEDEEEVVTFRIGGQYVPAAAVPTTSSHSGGKENEGTMSATPVKPHHHTASPMTSPRLGGCTPDIASSNRNTMEAMGGQQQQQQQQPLSPVPGRTPLRSTSTPLNSSPPMCQSSSPAPPVPLATGPPRPPASISSPSPFKPTRPSSVGKGRVLSPQPMATASQQEAEKAMMSPVDGSSAKYSGSIETSNQWQQQQMDGLARRVSAGLSMKYDATGEHALKYSQKEFDVLVHNKVEESRTQHEVEMRQMQERLNQATLEAQRWKQEYESFESNISAELSSVEADLALKQKDMKAELQSKEIQLKAVTAQLGDMHNRMEIAEKEAEEAKKKLEEAIKNEERLSKESAEKLEAEKARRVKDVLDMKERVAKHAQNQFKVAKTEYHALEQTLADKEAELAKVVAELKQAKIDQTEALRSKDKLSSKVKLLDEEVASSHRTIAQKDEEIARQATISETKIMELKATVDKITADRDLAVKDREQAYESLSRTAISLQDYKRKAEEALIALEEKTNEAKEHRQMCEELLLMVEAQSNQSKDAEPQAASGAME